MELIRAAKTKKPVQGTDVGLDTTLPIYVDDHLLRETRILWNGVRDMVDEGILSGAKCYDGKIKVRSYQGGPLEVLSRRTMATYRKWYESSNNGNRKNSETSSPEMTQQPHGSNQSSLEMGTTASKQKDAVKMDRLSGSRSNAIVAERRTFVPK